LVIPKDKTFLQHIHENLFNDSFTVAVRNHWKNLHSGFDKFEFHDGLLYHDELLYILKGLLRFQVLQARHNTLVVGHFGCNKTMELMFRDYWWPQLWKFVNEFVDSCDVCAHAKNPCHCLHGLFQPLPVHTSPWSSISMDFTMDFSQSNSFDSIMVVVDHFMKTTHFIPYNKSITNRKTTKLFLDHVYHGFFEDIIFYHGP
jgi:hypothetical protein